MRSLYSNDTAAAAAAVVYLVLEIKPCELGSRIRDVEAFWYKTEIKIIYFVQLCVIIWFTLFKTRNGLIYFSEDGG